MYYLTILCVYKWRSLFKKVCWKFLLEKSFLCFDFVCADDCLKLFEFTYCVCDFVDINVIECVCHFRFVQNFHFNVWCIFLEFPLYLYWILQSVFDVQCVDVLNCLKRMYCWIALMLPEEKKERNISDRDTMNKW